MKKREEWKIVEWKIKESINRYIYLYVGKIYYLIPKFFFKILIDMANSRKIFPFFSVLAGGGGFQARQVVLVGKGQPTLIRWAFVFLDSIEFLLPILLFEFPLEQPSISILWTISHFSSTRVQPVERDRGSP